MVLKRIFYLLLVLVSISSCAESEVSETTAEPKSTPNGKALFILNCASCHGADGKLGLSGAKDLSVTELSDQEIKNLIENGKNAMPSFKELLSKEGEIDAVIDHLSTLKKSK